MTKKYYRIAEIRDNNKETWDEFVHSCNTGTCYHSYGWNIGLREALKENAVIYSVENYNHKIVAGFTILEKSKFGIKIGIRPWATPHTGILLNNSCLKYYDTLDIIDTIIEFLDSEFHYLQLAMPVGYKEIYLFQKKKNWNINLKNTYRLIVNSRNLLEHVEPSTRRQIKKAQKKGIIVHESNDIRPLFEMYKNLFKKQGNPIRYSYEDFEKLNEIIYSHKIGKIIYAYFEDRPIAGMIINIFKNTHYYTISSCLPEYLSFGTPSFLLYEYMKTLDDGDVFDFVGALPHMESITKFKSKFNPYEEPYFLVEKGRNFNTLFNIVRKIRHLI